MLFLLGRTGTNTPEQDHWIAKASQTLQHLWRGGSGSLPGGSLEVECHIYGKGDEVEK